MNFAFKPLIDTFTKSQVQTVLLAWLPTKLSPYLTGIISVDMFVTTVIATGITSFAQLIYETIYYFINKNNNNNCTITLQIDYYSVGPYYERQRNLIYESLSWLISQESKKLEIGTFNLNVYPNINNKGNEADVPNSIILPKNDQEIQIEYKGNRFLVEFKIQENNRNNNINNNLINYSLSMMNQEKPAILLSLNNKDNSKTNMNKVKDLLDDLTKFYLDVQRKENGRFRYENTESRWHRIQKLSSCRGLDSVALDKNQEILIKKEITTFVNDKKFYEKTGMPYRRGILLFGNPGTGKTSLVNAISSHLSRDIYYLNLRIVKDDNELSTLFSAVPSNQLIVLEDVDSQSNVLLKRDSTIIPENFSNVQLKSKSQIICNFSLSKLLNCLDGHIMAEGNIIIMTTNHVNHLDPAVIRPGRMDLHLELGYCTRYQIKTMLNTFIKNYNISENTLNMIPEYLLPPCEIMTILTLHRNEKADFILEKLLELVKKRQTSDNLKEPVTKKRKLE